MNTIKGWGGGEKWHFENSIECQSRGYNVFFIANTGSVLLERLKLHDKIKTKSYVFSKHSYFNPIMMYKLYEFFKTESIDVVFFNSIRDMNTGSFAAKQAGVKRIILRYAWDHKVKNKFQTKLSFKYLTTDVFVNSKWVKKRLLDSRFLSEDNIEVLNNGVQYNDNFVKEQVEHDGIIIGFAGRLTFEKGIGSLILCMEVLNTVPVKLYIAGVGPDEDKIHQMVVAKNLTNQVKMLGFVDSMERFYSKIDILVHLTHADGISNAVIEAMMSKKPIIAYNIASMPEIVSNGENGYLVEVDDLQGVARSVCLFVKNKRLIDEFGECSYRLANKYYRFNNNFSILEKRYLKLNTHTQ